MHNRHLGRTGLSIAPLVFGGNVFGWTADKARSFDLLDRFVGAGLNAIDTADVYSAWAPGNKGGESEEIIGEWMKSRGNRDKVVVITKVGSEMGPGKKGLGARYIAQAAEASLKRLQVDHIDLYLSHWPDSETPYEETLGAYRDLIRQGKVRSIGASNLDAAQLRASLDVAKAQSLPRYDVLQPEYNLYDRGGFDGPLRDASPKRLASSLISVSPKVSCRANTAARPILAKAPAAAASKPISTRAARGFSARSMRSPKGSAPSPPKSRWPGRSSGAA
jgi:aryl-alcohol dehydrogenase-like predicted oxidoreductase